MPEDPNPVNDDEYHQLRQNPQPDHLRKQLPAQIPHNHHHQFQSSSGGGSGGGGGVFSSLMGFIITALSCQHHLFIFLAITLLTTLPYSLLLHTFSHSSQPLLDEIAFEAAVLPRLPPSLGAHHVSDELTVHVCKFLQRRAWYAFILFVLSLLSTVSVVNAASAVCLRQPPPSLRSLICCVRGTWPRIAVTSIVVYVFSAGFDIAVRVISSAILESSLPVGTGTVRGGIAATRAILSVVGSLGMVVSVLEERYGMEALIGAWDLLEGRRFAGWVMGGFQAGLSGCVGWCWWSSGRFVGAGSLCAVILVTDVVFTVFYLECKRRPQTDSASSKLKQEETL